MDAKLFVHVCMYVYVCVVWFTEQPCPRIGYAGEKAVLICKAQAADPQEIITYLWLASKIKDGNLVPVDRKLQTEDGVLSFDNLKDKDRGYYCCQAFNRRFLLTSGVVKLDVRLRSEKEGIRHIHIHMLRCTVKREGEGGSSVVLANLKAF